MKPKITGYLAVREVAPIGMFFELWTDFLFYSKLFFDCLPLGCLPFTTLPFIALPALRIDDGPAPFYATLPAVFGSFFGAFML